MDAGKVIIVLCWVVFTMWLIWAVARLKSVQVEDRKTLKEAWAKIREQDRWVSMLSREKFELEARLAPFKGLDRSERLEVAARVFIPTHLPPER